MKKPIAEICEIIERFREENPTETVTWIDGCGEPDELYEVAVELRQIGYDASVRPNTGGLSIMVRF